MRNPSAPPPLELPARLGRLLESRSPRLRADVERFLAEAPRRCTDVRSERVAGAPLRRFFLSRWLGLRAASPVLPVLDSKFGGAPYVEEAGLTWEGYSFLGQINFAQIEDPAPELPRRGLLALDVGPVNRGFTSEAFRVRWYPEPSEQRARSEAVPHCVGAWETRMLFSPGWSLPGGRAWHAPLPADDDELWEEWNDWSPEGFHEADGQHRLLGHRSAGLDEHYGFTPPPGRGHAIEAYEMLWSLTFDNPAGFHWGSNCLYVLIHEEDLAEGCLERAVVTGANS